MIVMFQKFSNPFNTGIPRTFLVRVLEVKRCKANCYFPQEQCYNWGLRYRMTEN
jgi:hypothetical protein